MRRIICSALVLLMIISFSLFATVAFADEAATPTDASTAVLQEGDVLDETVETVNFDDLYLSSLTVFDQNNSSESMFGGFIETKRVLTSFEISYDVTVMEAPGETSTFGLGVKNVVANSKKNLIKNGGYEILFGKNSRLDGVTTSLSTVSIVKNAGDGTTFSAGNYVVESLPTWLDFSINSSFNLKIGAVKILSETNTDEIKGFYVYVDVSNAEQQKVRIAEMYDYCDIESGDIGAVATGVVTGGGKYEITTKNSDNVTSLEQVKSYDILQLEQSDSAYYSENKGMFGRARTATDLSLEVNMRVIVEVPATSWNTFDIGLKNCYNGLFDHYHGGYDFRIGRNNSVSGGNTDDTVSIMRNGLFDGKTYPKMAIKTARLPSDYYKDVRTEGASYKLTVGLRRIMDGEEAVGYYAYIKYNDRLILDFYDYFDYEANLDYFGDVISGGVEAAGAYTITTCGETDKEYQELTEYDLSQLVPVTAEGLTYTGKSTVAESTEEVISRYLQGAHSLAVSYKLKVQGIPNVTFSLRGNDDGSTSDSVRFNLNVEEQTFRVYLYANGVIPFDSGNLNLSARGVVIEENTEYQIKYGVRPYKYQGCAEYDRAQVFISVDGVELYRYNIDYSRAANLGTYIGGRVIGSSNDKITLIPNGTNQVGVSVSAISLKESTIIGERNAVSYQSTAPFGLTKVEYIILSGDDVVTVDGYGVVRSIKAGTATVKVKLTTQYGVYESNVVELVVNPLEQGEDVLANYIAERTKKIVIWSVVGGVVGGAAIAVAIILIVKKRRKSK